MRSPLSDLHNALYTALNGIAGLTAYSFVPAEPDYPYVYIERKQMRSEVVATGLLLQRVRSKLVVATNSKDISVVEGIADDIEQALTATLTLANNWKIVRRNPIPDIDIFPANNFDGSQGHAAEIFYDFAPQDKA